MNQLQSLIHDALIGTDNVQNCAIIRRKEAVLKASSVGFNLYEEQIQMFIEAFKNTPQIREEGMYYEDKQYECVRADSSSIYLKHEQQGIVLVKTGTLVIVSTYSESMKPSICVEATEKLGDYFRQKDK
ncbi:profilin-4-like isoform X2 [Tubulanus polymorphus]